MARPSPYDEQTKQAIIEAAVSARKEGLKWNEAFSAAQEKGYKGGLQYLVKLIRSTGAAPTGKRRGRKPGRPAATAKVKAGKRGPGRPSKKSASTGGPGLNSIETIVDRMVEARVQKTVAEGHRCARNRRGSAERPVDERALGS